MYMKSYVLIIFVMLKLIVKEAMGLAMVIIVLCSM